MRRIFDVVKQQVLEFLHGEGCSISTIGRFLKYSKTTIGRWIANAAGAYNHEVEMLPGQKYEADELRTFVGNKKNECWIMYSLNQTTKSIVSFCIGRRTKENLQKVTDKILCYTPKMIYTDRLPMYGSLIPKSTHTVRKRKTNIIERRNGQLRLQLRRLNRRTICFSRSETMLRYSFLLYLKYVTTGSENYKFVL